MFMVRSNHLLSGRRKEEGTENEEGGAFPKADGHQACDLGSHHTEAVTREVMQCRKWRGLKPEVPSMGTVRAQKKDKSQEGNHQKGRTKK
jgi:hypothetical protein